MAAPKAGDRKIISLEVDLIDPNPFQQRKDFDTASLKELAESVKSQGLVQPISVRPHPQQQGRFQLISGERRLRAHKYLKRKTVDAIVRQDIDDAQLEELALIENVQREDLSPMEEANGYQRLLERHGGDLSVVVQKVGKSRATVEKRIALLQLASSVQALVDTRQISLEQAEVLLGVDDSEQQYRFAKAAITAKMDANKLKGIVQGADGAKKKNNRDGEKAKQVTFSTANRQLITISDVLERIDFSACKREDLETLKTQLEALVQQVQEDTLPNIERRLTTNGAERKDESRVQPNA